MANSMWSICSGHALASFFVLLLDEKSEASPTHTLTLAAYPKAAGGFTRTVEIVTDNKDQPKIIVPVTAKVLEK